MRVVVGRMSTGSPGRIQSIILPFFERTLAGSSERCRGEILGTRDPSLLHDHIPRHVLLHLLYVDAAMLHVRE